MKPGRYLYIATNEHKKGFFDPLKSVYKVLQLEDFKFLWAKKSAWWNQTIAAVGSTPPPTFDGYQAVRSCCVEGEWNEDEGDVYSGTWVDIGTS